MTVKWKYYTRLNTSTTFDKGQRGKLYFTKIYQLLVQKSDGTRIKIYNADGSNNRTEDELQVPVYGPSPVPFDCEIFFSKVNAGDSDDFMISILQEEL